MQVYIGVGVKEPYDGDVWVSGVYSYRERV